MAFVMVYLPSLLQVSNFMSLHHFLIPWCSIYTQLVHHSIIMQFLMIKNGLLLFIYKEFFASSGNCIINVVEKKVIVPKRYWEI